MTHGLSCFAVWDLPGPGTEPVSPALAGGFLSIVRNRTLGPPLENNPEIPPSSRDEGLRLLHAANPDMRIVLTVSPIRYRKYGYHGSQLSKSTLLLAVDKVIKMFHVSCLMFNVSCLMFHVSYFPAYEIINDELRDYRFYADDMLHPSSQAVEYIWQRFSEVYLSPEAKAFLKEWQPLKAALNHKPFNPDSDEYRIFMDKTMLKIAELQKKYPNFAL